MTDSEYQQQSKLANESRKAGNFQEALKIYAQLWDKKEDSFVGSGLLYCLRKTDAYDKALEFGEILAGKYPNFQWAQIEYVWTQIHCNLDRLDPEKEFEPILKIASKLMSGKLEDIAINHIVFKVLKAAKKNSRWDILNDWVDKINTSSLQDTPMFSEDGREGWSWKGLWSNYKIVGLVHLQQYPDALKYIEEALLLFPKQKKFFLRSKALIYKEQGHLAESEAIYDGLCRHPNSDWWIRAEYSQVLILLKKDEKALIQYCLTCQSRTPLKSLVNVIFETGSLLKRSRKHSDALAHFSLSRFIRNENEWSIPAQLEASVKELLAQAGCLPSNSMSEALAQCRGIWNNILKANVAPPLLRREIRGTVENLREGQAFCFIRAENDEAFFCLLRMLPKGVTNGTKVVFDAMESFDKKKNKKSWAVAKINNTY